MKDKAKKILKLGGIILITIIIIFSAIIIIVNKDQKAEKNVESLSDNAIDNKLLEEINQENESSIVEELQENEEITEKTSTENTKDVIIEKEIHSSNDNNISIEKNKEQLIENTDNKKVTETKKENNKNEKPSENVDKKEENSKTTDKKESNKTEQKVEENNSINNDANNNVNENRKDENTDNNKANSAETKPVETFKYNDKMAKKIKSIIENNESEYMKKYGYNVIIDESIVNLTNQFTFTENRVIDSLKYKFNTIKVYARDYYVNGTYMWTECFII